MEGQLPAFRSFFCPSRRTNESAVFFCKQSRRLWSRRRSVLSHVYTKQAEWPFKRINWTHLTQHPSKYHFGFVLTHYTHQGIPQGSVLGPAGVRTGVNFLHIISSFNQSACGGFLMLCLIPSRQDVPETKPLPSPLSPHRTGCEWTSCQQQALPLLPSPIISLCQLSAAGPRGYSSF